MGYSSSFASSNSCITRKESQEKILQFRLDSSQLPNSRAVKPAPQPARQSQGITKETTESPLPSDSPSFKPVPPGSHVHHESGLLRSCLLLSRFLQYSETLCFDLLTALLLLRAHDVCFLEGSLQDIKENQHQSKEINMLEGSGAASAGLQHTCPVFAIVVIIEVRLFLG